MSGLRSCRRHDAYPNRRGFTGVLELTEAELSVAFASARPTVDRGFHTRGVVSLSIRCGNADIRTHRARRLVLPIFIHRA